MRKYKRLLISLLLLAADAAAASDLTGRASVIDGDTLEIRGVRIRIWGIDAPEHDQLCRGEDSLFYRCGAKAANKLYDFIAQGHVSCAPRATDRYGRTIAACSLDRVDLGKWLVSQGLALDWPQYSGGFYAAAQDEAQKASRGMWSGSFAKPWLFRSCTRFGRRPAECSDETDSHDRR